MASQSPRLPREPRSSVHKGGGGESLGRAGGPGLGEN